MKKRPNLKFGNSAIRHIGKWRPLRHPPYWKMATCTPAAILENGWHCPVILPKFRLPRKFKDLLRAANLRHWNVCTCVCVYIYIYIIASCWGLEFQFLSVPPHSKTSLSVYALRSQPTIALGYVVQQWGWRLSCRVPGIHAVPSYVDICTSFLDIKRL